jgi:hypothetical protein
MTQIINLSYSFTEEDSDENETLMIFTDPISGREIVTSTSWDRFIELNHGNRMDTSYGEMQYTLGPGERRAFRIVELSELEPYKNGTIRFVNKFRENNVWLCDVICYADKIQVEELHVTQPSMSILIQQTQSS